MPLVVFPLASLLHLQLLLLYFRVLLRVVCLYSYSYVNIFTDSFGNNLVLQMCMSIYACLTLYCILYYFCFSFFSLVLSINKHIVCIWLADKF